MNDGNRSLFLYLNTATSFMKPSELMEGDSDLEEDEEEDEFTMRVSLLWHAHLYIQYFVLIFMSILFFFVTNLVRLVMSCIVCMRLMKIRTLYQE